ncbi:MAG: hypothetical protein HOD60_03695 [Candidatus Nitrosopelagicus sp.]|jgi:hypothetical protein|nr:hypothetical protein [Candidatus Nitrosopelagicus sp.]
MKIVMCKKHKIECSVPTTNEEFYSGKWHEDIMRIQTHAEKFPQCKMRFRNVNE